LIQWHLINTRNLHT